MGSGGEGLIFTLKFSTNHTFTSGWQLSQQLVQLGKLFSLPWSVEKCLFWLCYYVKVRKILKYQRDRNLKWLFCQRWQWFPKNTLINAFFTLKISFVWTSMNKISLFLFLLIWGFSANCERYLRIFLLIRSNVEIIRI